MAIYLVTWDLNREKLNYAAARARLVGRLDGYDSVKDSGLDSVRWVSTNWTADQVSSDLRGYMDGNDKLIVTKLNRGEHQGWLAKTVWDWINARL